jgi:hypothetical protein
MRWFALSRNCLALPPLLNETFEQLKQTALAIFDAWEIVADDDALTVECIAFLLWSVHIAIINSGTSGIDKWLAHRLLARQVRQAGSLPVMRDAADPELVTRIFSRRRVEVLPTIWNVYFTSDQAGALVAPVTRRTARLFIERISCERRPARRFAEAEMAAALHHACISTISRMDGVPIQPRTCTMVPGARR